MCVEVQAHMLKSEDHLKSSLLLFPLRQGRSGLLAYNFWRFSCLGLPQSHGISEKHSFYCLWFYVVLGNWTQVATFAVKWFIPWPVSVAWDSAPLLPCFPECEAVVPETWQVLSKCAKWLSGWISVWSQGTEWGYQWAESLGPPSVAEEAMAT